MKVKYDFSGYATRNDLRCTDGVTIRHNAFKDNNGKRVPLVWSHKHDSPENVLGHADLENRDDGVYAYCAFNNTDLAQKSKLLVQHGDIDSLSIWANKLTKSGSDILHGDIIEVSLVLAGANPGAVIDAPIIHSDATGEGIYSETEAAIYTGETFDPREIEIEHSDEKEESSEEKVEHSDDIDHSDDKQEESKVAKEDKTIEEVYNSMTDEQKMVLEYMVSEALKEKTDDEIDEEENDEMKHNIFENINETKESEDYISHDDMQEILKDATRCGSMREAFISHGIENIEWLFPKHKLLNNTPDFVKRDTGWVGNFMNGVSKTPFSRIRSIFADITADEARAKGYTKGNKKLEEVFTLLRRRTGPTTIYKKQAIDRDDVIDITDFDVVAFIKGEMRGMLDEEIARAAFISDGRSGADNDKIEETAIRPIWKDDDFYNIKARFAMASGDTSDNRAKKFINSAIRARKYYKGSGDPTLYCTEDILADILLLEDLNGRTIYESVAQVATKLRVKEIVTVPVFENKTREVDGVEYTLHGIIVNLKDYTIGADKGGAVNTFEDFDIDYNKQKYLIETRCSGALTKPYSAITLESYETSSSTTTEETVTEGE